MGLKMPFLRPRLFAALALVVAAGAASVLYVIHASAVHAGDKPPPDLARLEPANRAEHPPRILLLYGSLRERSYSRLLVPYPPTLDTFCVKNSHQISAGMIVAAVRRSAAAVAARPALVR